MGGMMGGQPMPVAEQQPQERGIKVQAANYGAPVPVAYGQQRVPGNVIDYFDFTTIQTNQSVGKGGGQNINKYSYSSSVVESLGEGPIAAVVSIWKGTGQVFIGTGAAQLQATFIAGNPGQAPWSVLPGTHALGYDSTALIGIQNLNLGSSASMPNLTYECRFRLCWDATNAKGYGVVVDAEPSTVVNDILTNAQYGLGFTGFVGDLTAFSDFCTANGLFVSPVYDQQTTGEQVLNRLLNLLTVEAVWSDGQLKFIPYGDETVTGYGATYTPQLTAAYNLTDTDYITTAPGQVPITVQRVDTADLPNTVRLEYYDRTYFYSPAVIEFKDQNDAFARSTYPVHQIPAHEICLQPVASYCAQAILQRALYVRNRFKFKLSYNFALLEPMDIVTLTDVNLGLNRYPVRIVEVDEDEGGLLSITAEDLAMGTGQAAPPPSVSPQGYSLPVQNAPGSVVTPVVTRGSPLQNQAWQCPPLIIGVGGSTEWYGGCDVWGSTDGSHYNYLETRTGNSRIGSIALNAWAASQSVLKGYLIEDANGNTQQCTTAGVTGAAAPAWATSGTTADGTAVWTFVSTGLVSLPASVDPDLTDLATITLTTPTELSGGSQADADNLQTLFQVGDELIAYETATLIAPGQYALGYLRRGCYGTAIVAHVPGEPFIRLDKMVAEIAIDPSSIGQNYWLKFASFNIFGMQHQDLSAVTAYEYTLGSTTVVPDVPPTPGNFAIKEIDAGLHFSWINTIPEAVSGSTIEYSPDTVNWSILASVGGNASGYTSHNAPPVSTWYRMRSRSVLFNWSGYTTALQANGGAYVPQPSAPFASNLIPDSDFVSGLAYWNYAAPWTIVTGPFGNAFACPGTGNPVIAPNIILRTTTIMLLPGDYIFSAYADTTAVSAGNVSIGIYAAPNSNPGAYTPGTLLTSLTFVPNEKGRLSASFTLSVGKWATSTAVAAGDLITDPNGDLQIVSVAGTTGAAAPAWSTVIGGTTTDGTATWLLLNFAAVIPATPLFNANGATINGDLLFANPQLETSNAANAPTNYKPRIGDLNTGSILIDVSKPGHLNKTLDYIGDGTTYARTLATTLSGGYSLRKGIDTILQLAPTHYWPISYRANISLDDLGSAPETLTALSGSTVGGIGAGSISGMPTPGDNGVLAQFSGAYWAQGTANTQNLTVCGMIVSPSVTPSAQIVLMGLANGNTTSAPSQYSPLIWITTDGYVRARVGIGSDLEVASAIPLTFRDPHFVLASIGYNSATNTTFLYLFVDGMWSSASRTGAPQLLSPLYYLIAGSWGGGVWPTFPGSGLVATPVVLQDICVFEGVSWTNNYVQVYSIYQALTQGRSSASGFLYRGSTPPSAANVHFTYTSNDASITWSWAAFTIFWPDGEQETVNAGSLVFSGLAASTTYYFYPTVRLADGTIQWPGGANTGRSYLYASEQYQFGSVGLTAGGMTASTAATGGSGGGGFNGCLDADQPVWTKRGIGIPARELVVGDELYTAARTWTPIRTIEHAPETEWVTINDQWTVTPTQPFLGYDGGIIHAAELDVGDRLQGERRAIRVRSVVSRKRPGTKVIIGIDPPHWFVLDESGLIVHNGSVKP